MTHVRVFDHATWLAARTQVAGARTPTCPDVIVLPGAFVPITTSKLAAHIRAGDNINTVVERVNEKWYAENNTRPAGNGSGEYQRQLGRAAMKHARDTRCP